VGETVSKRIVITGTVQGVGFRPHVYKLARSMGLAGTVRNSGRGVLVEVEGPGEIVRRFIAAVQENLPCLAAINACEVYVQPLRGYRDFTIVPTRGETTGESVVPPDTAACPDCRREIMDPADRHYWYPFTNCTCCGPRFTIIQSLPYDRARTAMAGFAMCERCSAEYKDPVDRRFHAQPVACPECGPRVSLVDRCGKAVPGDWVAQARRLLAGGKIIAVKGLGGFHLACNGEDPVAVMNLRRRKGRPARPLAVMCRDIAMVRRHCRVSPAEEALLRSSAAPIVVLERKPSSTLPRELAPGINSIGVMLPYTPLHILLQEKGPGVLVMTSGNRSGLPLARDNREALQQLGEVADYFLLHNRDILHRCDDSVVRAAGGGTQFIRRSRGYVPQSIALPGVNGAAGEMVCFGAGGDMKNTFCLVKAGRAYLSQHVGEVDTLEGADNYRECVENFRRLLRMEPVVVGYDLHPGYHSAKLARSLIAGRHVGVQHHHAHMAACMAENGLEERVIGAVLDGTGYGSDGNIWGFEILLGDYLGFTREWHLEYVPLPGGERAVRNPWVTAVAYLVKALGEEGLAIAKKIFPDKQKEISIIQKIMQKGINAPPASSCGRFFDAVAALLGVCLVNTYDGQAAIELGEMAPARFRGTLEPYPFNLRNGVIEVGLVIKAIVSDLDNKINAEKIAGRFHDTVAAMVVKAVDEAGAGSGLDQVVLSGGCWYNRYMLEAVSNILVEKGFRVYRHRQIPTGDGGICLGQAMVAGRQYCLQPG